MFTQSESSIINSNFSTYSAPYCKQYLLSINHSILSGSGGADTGSDTGGESGGFSFEEG